MSDRAITSATDLTDFEAFCGRAATHADIFANFRSEPTCRAVVDTMEWRDGLNNLIAALSLRPDYLLRLSEFRRNDEIGGPWTYSKVSRHPEIFNYSGLGRFSPTTFRYVRVAAHIHRLFGSFDGKRIAEIGGGYGGQARILSAAHRLASLSVYDLPPVLSLAERYLRALGVSAEMISAHSFAAADYDLVISNYAFSEMTGQMQGEYFDKVISRAKHGYFLFNKITDENWNSLSPEKFVARLPHKATIVASTIGSDRLHGIRLVYW
ncbi:MAG: putative sugar O-methyltransferase [Rhizomicrobium sp.]|jgi:hypothetical protein